MTFKKEICSRCGKLGYIFDERLKLCWNCREQDRIKDLQTEAVKEGKTSGEDYIICPYCGYDYGTDDMHESTDAQCPKCNKEFHIEINYSVDYSTSKIEEQTSGETKNDN